MPARKASVILNPNTNAQAPFIHVMFRNSCIKLKLVAGAIRSVESISKLEVKQKFAYIMFYEIAVVELIPTLLDLFYMTLHLMVVVEFVSYMPWLGYFLCIFPS